MSKFPIAESEIELSAIRASGPGGQHVNKVSSAIQLQYGIRDSSLPDEAKARLLAFRDRRINADGLITIKAQRFRSQEQNRRDAIERLQALVDKATEEQKPRKASRPGRAAKERRHQQKKRQADKKSTRAAVSHRDY